VGQRAARTLAATPAAYLIISNAMPDSEARAIIRAALALSASHAHAPVLDVLDLAMDGRHD
jgi:hypothetical protein